MENFRKKLRKDSIIYCGFAAIGVIGLVLMVVFGSDNPVINSLGGLCGSLLAVSVLFIIRNKKALSSEKLLKELYIRNTDERNIKIATSSAKTTFYIILAGLSIGARVAGFFSTVVSATLSVCFFGVMLVYVAVTAYYNKKM